MDWNSYLMPAKEFIFDRQFLNLLISTLVLFSASLLSWIVYYKQLAKRDLFEIPKQHPSSKLINAVYKTAYLLKYVIVFPVYSFIWFLIFSFLLFALSKSRPVNDVLFLGIIVVAATRIGAYANEKLAEDMAKLLPLTLIAIFLIDPKAVDFGTLKSSFEIFIVQVPIVLKYLLFIIVLEWALRSLRGIFAYLEKPKEN